MDKKFLIREYYSLCPNGVCDITLLTEDEKRLRNDGYTILTGIFQSADKLNGNGRIYPRKTLEREVDNYQNVIKERRSVGSTDHPENTIVELKDASHLVLRMWWDGHDVWGVTKVLKNTDAGRNLEGLIKDDVQFGISSRSLGSVRETREGTIVEDDLQLICFDVVSEPSTPNAYLHLKEVKENEVKKVLNSNQFGRKYRINSLLDNILQKK